MTIEDKLLLIKDLSARLPYGVEVEHTKTKLRSVLHEIRVYPKYGDNDVIYDAICYTDFFGDGDLFDITMFKPFLFPMDNMTDEQCDEWVQASIDDEYGEKSIEWLRKNHFDFMGLIPKDLAIDATGKNIYGI